MKKILATGFVPFAGGTVNPAGEVVKRLKQPEGAELVTVILPVEYGKTREELRSVIVREKPDIVLSFGQGGICPALTPEMVAINFATTRGSDGRVLAADESGKAMDDVPLEEGRPTAYFTTLPVRKMCRASQAAGVEARISYSAGTYLCNATMYTALDEAAKNYPGMRCDFIHTPYLPEQMPADRPAGMWPGIYCMELDDMVKGAQAIIDLLASEDC